MNYFIIIPLAIGLVSYTLAYFFQKKHFLRDLFLFFAVIGFITVAVQIIHSKLTEDIPVISKIASFIFYGAILIIGLMTALYLFYKLIIFLKYKIFR